MANRWKQKWIWILVGMSVLVPAALAVCYSNITLIHPDGSELHCSSFCVVERSGWICAH